MNQQKASSRGLEDYIPVADRVEQFYSRFPDGRIITRILEHDRESGFVLMQAEIYRHPDDAQPASTGHAYEIKGQGFVNNTSHIENCETGAVGRALAMLGFEVKRGIASREEMQKVERMQQRPALQEVKAKPENATAVDYIVEINTYWQKLKNLGLARFDNLNAQFGHLRAWLRKENWTDEQLEGVKKVGDVPQDWLRVYASKLIDLYESEAEKARG